MDCPSIYPDADGSTLDAIAANMGLARLKAPCRNTGGACDHDECSETDEQFRKRVIDYLSNREGPLEWRLLGGLKQWVAIWLSKHGMPTFAAWLYPGYHYKCRCHVAGSYTYDRINGELTWP